MSPRTTQVSRHTCGGCLLLHGSGTGTDRTYPRWSRRKRFFFGIPPPPPSIAAGVRTASCDLMFCEKKNCVGTAVSRPRGKAKLETRELTVVCLGKVGRRAVEFHCFAFAPVGAGAGIHEDTR